MTNEDARLAQSWVHNAGSWTRVVREGLIPSRRAGTDAAILDAIAERHPKRVLDMGCGEGWLARAVAARTGCAAVGADGSAALIADARAADPEGCYLVLDYAAFAAHQSEDLGEDFDVAVFNYSLFAEDISQLLRATAARLAPGGILIIQTLHPGPAGEDGWRAEDFSSFEGDNWAPMPWFYRTLDSWRAVLADADLTLRYLREPQAADGRVLSLLMVCERA